MKSRVGRIVSLAAILALSLGVGMSSPADAQDYWSCVQWCQQEMAGELNACEMYLVPDGNGGWLPSTQYEGCVTIAHIEYEMCESLCIIQFLY
ncbi:MAG: hypothetical protein AAGC60_00740 [Acidobacteriota bacterium]